MAREHDQVVGPTQAGSAGHRAQVEIADDIDLLPAPPEPAQEREVVHVEARRNAPVEKRAGGVHGCDRVVLVPGVSEPVPVGVAAVVRLPGVGRHDDCHAVPPEHGRPDDQRRVPDASGPATHLGEVQAALPVPDAYPQPPGCSGGSSGSLADDHAVHLVPPEPGDGHGSRPEDAEIDGAAGTGDDERHERAGRGTLAQEVGLDADLRRRRTVGEPDGGGCDEKKCGDPAGNGQVATVPRLAGHVQRAPNVRRADTSGACPPPSRCRREAQKAGIRSRRRLTRRATATRTRLTAMPIAIPTPASSQSNPDGPVSGSACGRSTVAGPERGASVV